MNTSKTVKTVAIYARESHGQDEDSSISVTDQVDSLMVWVEREGWSVHKVIKDVGSASRNSNKKRTRFDELLAVIESGEVDAVLAWEQSRFTRTDGERAELEDLCEDVNVLLGWGSRLYDMSKADDRLTSGITGVVSAAESRRSAERIRRRTAAAAKAGQVHGKQLYGFTRAYETDNRGKRKITAIVPHPEQGPVVERVFRDALDHKTPYAIAKDLNADGIPPRRPSFKPDRVQIWTPEAVREMLRNPAYAGRRVWTDPNGARHVYDAMWKGLVTPEKFDQVQSILATRSTPAKGRRPTHLLTGIAVCDVCGSTLTSQKQNAGRAKLADGSPNPARYTYRSYMCGGHRRMGGFHVAMKETHLDELVTTALLARLSRPDFLAHAETDDGRVDEQRADLLAEIDKYTEYLSQVNQQAAESLDASILFEQQRLIRPKIDAAQKALERLMGVDPTVMALAGSQDVSAAWEGLDLDTQRQIIKATMTPVVKRLERGVRGRKGINPDRVEIRWHTWG